MTPDRFNRRLDQWTRHSQTKTRLLSERDVHDQLRLVQGSAGSSEAQRSIDHLESVGRINDETARKLRKQFRSFY